MVSINVSSARSRPSRPLRNGWTVRVKQEPCRWASVSSAVHIASDLAGSSMTPGPNSSGTNANCSQSSSAHATGISTMLRAPAPGRSASSYGTSESIRLES